MCRHKINFQEILHQEKTKKCGGFSLLELMIAMTILLTGLVIASNLLVGCLQIRGRERQQTSAQANLARALNVLAREANNTGFGMADNGIVAGDSSAVKLRIRANLNGYEGGFFYQINPPGTTTVSEASEDVLYRTIPDTDGTLALVRQDVALNTSAVVARGISTLTFHYYSGAIRYTPDGAGGITTTAAEVPPAQCYYIVIAAGVNLPTVGSPGTPGYQPAQVLTLTTDVALRNRALITY